MGGFILAGILCGLVAGLQPAASQNEKSVRICHATASESNPYASQEPAIGNNGDLQGGHLNHTGPVFVSKAVTPDWGDIIPPYDYIDADGNPQTFPGYNWTPEGQAIWQNDCKPGLDPLTPTVECVEPQAGGGFLAHFGYSNPNSVNVVAPFDNKFTPPPENRGQPTTFTPGNVRDAVQAASTGPPLTWSLTGNTVTASSDSQRCKGSITIVKVLNPSNDKGRFNLEIGGTTAGTGAAAGDGDTTGTIAVNTGQHTVGESPAQGTDLADYDTLIKCVNGSGSSVGESTTPTVTINVGRDENVLCTIVNTRKGQLQPIAPTLDCVVFTNGVPDTAVWGYNNENAFPVTLPAGSATNTFAPGPADRGQPSVFEPGTWPGEVQTPFNGSPTVAWTIAGQTVTASASSPRCTATLELRKVTDPANDPGVFNLLVNGRVLATGGNGTTTGPVTVGVGEGTVSETAGPGTTLADFDSTVTCTRNGTPEVSVDGTHVDGEIAQGDVVVCTFTNRRLANPTPEPPTPPSTEVDLAIEKSATPTTVDLGQNITWTVKVTNNSSTEAADVNVVKVSDHSYRTKLISLTTSQGTCTVGTGCSLGRLAPGATATITAVTQATQIGTILNVVRVGSEEQETDYTNNVASALVRVVGPFKPPQPRPVCHTLGAAPRVLRQGTSSVVLTIAKSRFGATIPGVLVRMRGRGIDQRARTNSRGIARFAVTPSQRGFVFFSGASRATAAKRAPCATFLAVLAAKSGSVTG